MADSDDLIRHCLDEADPVRRRSLVSSLPLDRFLSSTPPSLAAALFDDEDVGRRSAAMEVCASLGERALPLLEQGLSDPRVGVRRRVADVLGMMSSPRAMPLLRRALFDDNLAVRTAGLEGITRLGREQAGPILVEQLDSDVPASLALVALLGVEQLQLSVPPALVRRWLDDPLTAVTALRVLGRAGELSDVSLALQSTNRQKARAALVGLAAALERGHRLELALDEPSRARVLATLADGDLESARAALVVLAHAHDVRAFAVAIARVDAVHFLPTLHRAVALCQDAGVPMLEVLSALSTAGVQACQDAARELEHAARRRFEQAPLLGLTSPDASFFSATAYAALTEWFASKAGLAMSEEARPRLEARLLPRLEARGARTLDEYLVLLERDRDEAALAIDAVTVHETYFFREMASLDGLRDDLVPALAETSRPLRVWSAGCSSGEEAYTLAITLAELERAGRCGSFSVIGTDISPVSIASARKSTYGPRSFRAPLTPAQRASFEPVADGWVTPNPTLRARVRFSVQNLLDGAGLESLPRFDVIFCRNVLIYMTPLARRTILHAFFQHLRPGGALVLGHAESLLHVENPFELWPLRRGLAYRRGAP
jgi:chemotaxis protein methyltransferase CheR